MNICQLQRRVSTTYANWQHTVAKVDLNTMGSASIGECMCTHTIYVCE